MLIKLKKNSISKTINNKMNTEIMFEKWKVVLILKMYWDVIANIRASFWFRDHTLSMQEKGPEGFFFWGGGVMNEPSMKIKKD